LLIDAFRWVCSLSIVPVVKNDARLPFLHYLEGEKNMSFEDLERSLEDIIFFFFHTLYLWTAAFVSHRAISYDDFLVRSSISS